MESLTEEQRALFADGGQLDDYEVLKPIGKGKFSVVFKAKRRRDGQAVALKKIAIFDLMNLKAREKTLKEVRLVQSVSHSNIIQYLDAFVQNNELYIAFEWAEAGDLKRQIRKANEKGHDSSPIVVAQKILLAAEKVGVPEVAQLSAPALSSGVGIEVCELLDALTTAVVSGEEYCIIPPAYPREPIEIVESCDVLDATDDEGQQNSSSDGFGESTTSLDTEDDGVFSRWVVVKEERQFSGDDKENAMIYTYIDPVAWELERRRMLPKLHAVLQDKLHHRPAESSWRVRLDQVQTHAGAIVAGQEDMRNEISQIQASRQQQTDQLKRYEKMLNNRFLRARRLYDEGTTRLSKAQSVMQCAQENVNHATVEVARLQAARSEQANALKAADARLTDNSKLLERKRQIRHLKNENRELGLKLQVLQDYWNRKQQHATQRRIRQSPQV
ncbi:hypothetical protein PF008_g8993 [Phytophthora fragariae]|uniref:Protein kinase domain-containing protein n=1 Tax=Phytophthora fragariae TaxID=53985 RepID=A0A6G0RY25_9STRA|nr:hypothetical protein PF008_g8993 [Phytophthora fragariae]